MILTTNLTKENAIALGFCIWKDNLYLIPETLYPLIPDGTELTCINGTKVIKGKDEIDMDTRAGLLTYCIIL